MRKNWMSRFSDNIRDYDGYTIGKLFKLLDDPEMISLPAVCRRRIHF